MKGNDISNYVEPRLLFVFEGLLGNPPKKDTKLKRALKWHRWETAVNEYELNEMTVHIINDIVWRKRYNVDVITWHPPEFAKVLEDRLSDEGVWVSRVVSDNSVRLARSLPFRLDIAMICDPDPKHTLRYGAKGRFVDDTSRDWFGGMI